MDKFLALLAGVGWLALGCTGTYQQSGQKTTTTTAKSPASAELDVKSAGMPYKILRAKGGQEIPTETFYGELGAADAICVGEQHSDPHHHWAQLEVLGKVSERRAGKAGALGLEMFQRPFQGVLDDYAAKRISKRDLLARSGWDDRWGFNFALYAPIIDLAIERGMSLLALNVSTELRKKLSAGGMAALTGVERTRIPDLVLDDEEHIAWFDQALGSGGPHVHGDPHGSHQHGAPPIPADHPPVEEPLPEAHPPVQKPPLPQGHLPVDQGHGHAKPAASHSHGARVRRAGPRPRNASMTVYRSQVLWDETMAETSSRWVQGGADRQVIILAGYGHCHDSAIVRRMRRRGIGNVVSVRPVVDSGDGRLASELAQPVADYLFVMTRPSQ